MEKDSGPFYNNVTSVFQVIPLNFFFFYVGLITYGYWGIIPGILCLLALWYYNAYFWVYYKFWQEHFEVISAPKLIIGLYKVRYNYDQLAGIRFRYRSFHKAFPEIFMELREGPYFLFFRKFRLEIRDLDNVARIVKKAKEKGILVNYEISQDRIVEVLRQPFFKSELMPSDDGIKHPGPGRKRYLLRKRRS